MKRALVLCALLVTLGASLAGPASAANAARTSAERLLTLDQQILAGLNESRAKHGLRPLVMSSKLQEAAVFHSRAMLQGGFFAHDTPGGASFAARVRGFYRSAGYNSWSVGENLLYSTEAVTANTAIAAWLASPGHRENMLMPEWREVGIGSLRANAASGLFGGEATWVVTMDFGTRSGKIETKAVPTKVKNSSKATPGAKVKKNRSAAKNRTAKSAKQKANATKGLKPKRTPARSKTVDRVLPQPSHSSDDESDDSADDQSADAGADEDEDVDPDDESEDDDSNGGDIDELAFRSGW